MHTLPLSGLLYWSGLSLARQNQGASVTGVSEWAVTVAGHFTPAGCRAKPAGQAEADGGRCKVGGARCSGTAGGAEGQGT